MIYVNNAATTWPKPELVYKQVDDFFRNSGLNPGRSGSIGISATERNIFEVRKKVANLIGVSDSSRIVFTSGSTQSLNIALKGLLQVRDHVITTKLEHNSVLRPLKKLEQDRDIEITFIDIDDEGNVDFAAIENAINAKTKLIITTHASNVIGSMVDIKRIGRLARERGVMYLVDAAQTAGVFAIDVKEMGIDLLALAGHKSLYGPPGIGVLYIREGIELDTLIEGGTGTNSLATSQPQILPDKYESGTANNLGIVGLGAGIDFINQQRIEEIRKHELELTELLLAGLDDIKETNIYGKKNIEFRAPVVGLNIKGLSSAKIGYILENEFDIYVRSGLHCAPLLHQALGTDKEGMLRISFGYFNTKEEVDIILDSLKKIISRK